MGDPIRYGYHDAVLRQLIEYRRHPADLMRWYLNGELLERLEWGDREAFSAHFADADAWLEDLDWVERQLRSSFFKRIQSPPLIVLSKRAFGFDLRETQWPAYQPRGLRRAPGSRWRGGRGGRGGREKNGTESPRLPRRQPIRLQERGGFRQAEILRALSKLLKNIERNS